MDAGFVPSTPVAIGTRLELEFQYSDDSFPITIEEAVVRSSADGAIGLRFTQLRRSDERRIRQHLMCGFPNSCRPGGSGAIPLPAMIRTGYSWRSTANGG